MPGFGTKKPTNDKEIVGKIWVKLITKDQQSMEICMMSNFTFGSLCSVIKGRSLA